MLGYKTSKFSETFHELEKRPLDQGLEWFICIEAGAC